MRDFFRQRPFFCILYILAFGLALAVFAWLLSDAFIGVYRFVRSGSGPGGYGHDAAGLPESILGTLKFFTAGGSLADERLRGGSWPSLFRENSWGTLICASCLLVPVCAKRRVAIIAIGFVGIVMALLSLYFFVVLPTAHGPAGSGGIFTLLLLATPAFAAYCLYVARREWQ